MSQTFSLSNRERAVEQQSIYEIPTATLFLRAFCTASFVSELVPDAALRAFAHLPQREHQLLRTIAERADSILTLAYTAQRVIVGQVSLVPAGGRWQGLANVYEIAIEVSAGWRRQGIAWQLLKMVSELESSYAAYFFALNMVHPFVAGDRSLVLRHPCVLTPSRSPEP